MYLASLAVIANSGTLTERLSALHTRLLETVPIVDRIACALYEAKDDQLKTFINSTRTGEAIVGYEASLSNSHALSQLAQSGGFRVLDDIASAIHADTAHSQWLKAQGYQSSFTVPLFDRGKLLGFIFFDSCQRAAFTPQVQRDLVLYTSLISMMIASEMATIRAMIESTKLARELTELRDFETGAHLDRMARYSRLIARAIAPQRGLNDEFVEGVYLFAPMHDIGKIGIPDRILLKPGRLDPDERAIMDSHVAKGVEIIERIIGKARHIKNPIEAAFFLWVNIAYLQPFADGNKRTSRLSANLPLLLQLLPTISPTRNTILRSTQTAPHTSAPPPL